MAKTRRSATSLASQRNQRQPQNREKNQRSRRNRYTRARQQRKQWLIIGGILATIAMIIGLFLFLGHQPAPNANTTSQPNATTLDATSLKQITDVDANLLSQTGTGGVANPFKPATGNPPALTGPTGKPEIFFYGAEWCPLCAAERWSIAVALSRFGTWHNLQETTSASDDSYPNTSTLSFARSSYTSQYIDFVPVETQDRQRNTLQTPAAQEQAILQRYNVTGFPFMDIGNRYLVTSASYDPGVLRTNTQDPNSDPLTQQEIASQISTGNTLSHNILGTANYLTAAICSNTNNQPAQVCNDSSIKLIESTLSQTSQTSTTHATLDAFFWKTGNIPSTSTTNYLAASSIEKRETASVFSH